MPHSLIIVESPTKVKTIRKFLGSNYEVHASMGHIKDLPKSKLGRAMAKKLKVYRGDKHPHEAQKPEAAQSVAS